MVVFSSSYQLITSDLPFTTVVRIQNLSELLKLRLQLLLRSPDGDSVDKELAIFRGPSHRVDPHWVADSNNSGNTYSSHISIFPILLLNITSCSAAALTLSLPSDGALAFYWTEYRTLLPAEMTQAKIKCSDRGFLTRRS